MDGGDGGHESEPAGGSAQQRSTHERDTLGDGGLIPAGSVLVGQQDKLPIIT